MTGTFNLNINESKLKLNKGDEFLKGLLKKLNKIFTITIILVALDQ